MSVSVSSVPGRRSPSAGLSARTALDHGVFGLVPILLTGFVVAVAIHGHAFAVDFHHAFWPAGRNVLHGFSPYVAPGSPLVRRGVAFVYPAPGALFFAGLAWLPSMAADIFFTVASLASALGALWILGIRDWRLYGVLLLWAPVVSGWQTANLTLLLTFGIAAAWRVRDRPVPAGLIVGLLVSLKLFVWPIGLWLLATRRYAALGWAVASTLVVNVFAWAVLGFDQFHAYAVLVRAVTRVEESQAYTPVALLERLGVGRGAAHAAGVLIATLVAASCVVQGRRRKDQSALVLAIVLCMLVTPVVWIHYFALFLVPLAINRQRLSPVWLLALVLFPCPVTKPALWQLWLALAVVSLLVGRLLWRPRESSAASETYGSV